MSRSERQVESDTENVRKGYTSVVRASPRHLVVMTRQTPTYLPPALRRGLRPPTYLPTPIVSRPSELPSTKMNETLGVTDTGKSPAASSTSETAEGVTKHVILGENRFHSGHSALSASQSLCASRLNACARRLSSHALPRGLGRPRAGAHGSHGVLLPSVVPAKLSARSSSAVAKLLTRSFATSHRRWHSSSRRRS